MAEMADIEVDGETLAIAGLLSVDTVNQYYQKGLDAIDHHDRLTVDLAAAEIVGSAGVALLIAWQRRAYEREKVLKIINAPEHFLAMAAVSGVRDILPFEQ